MSNEQNMKYRIFNGWYILSSDAALLSSQLANQRYKGWAPWLLSWTDLVSKYFVWILYIFLIFLGLFSGDFFPFFLLMAHPFLTILLYVYRFRKFLDKGQLYHLKISEVGGVKKATGASFSVIKPMSYSWDTTVPKQFQGEHNDLNLIFHQKEAAAVLLATYDEVELLILHLHGKHFMTCLGVRGVQRVEDKAIVTHEELATFNQESERTSLWTGLWVYGLSPLFMTGIFALSLYLMHGMYGMRELRALVQKEGLIGLRASHQTKLRRKVRDKRLLETPRSKAFRLVKYQTPIGKMGAYISVPTPGAKAKKHPAILWVAGGFPPGGAGNFAWIPQPKRNDQSGRAYRLAGMIMMYPTFRGASGNPGFQEGLYGEVTDLLAAAKYLAKVEYVDPQSIFLAGHSTGGTLVLLAAAMHFPFRAVLSFGPVAKIRSYSWRSRPFISNNTEFMVRSPVYFLNKIKTTTYIIEGEKGNIRPLRQMRRSHRNQHIKTIQIKGGGHFDILAPCNQYIAKIIMRLKAGQRLQLDASKLQKAYTSSKGAHQ